MNLETRGEQVEVATSERWVRDYRDTRVRRRSRGSRGRTEVMFRRYRRWRRWFFTGALTGTFILFVLFLAILEH